MEIDVFEHEDGWQDVKDSTMNTIGKNTGKYPTSGWKRRLILSEHSPIRRIKFYWRWVDLKSWVSVHFVRHKIGIEHWVSTQRTDRTGVNRDELSQGSLVRHACEADWKVLNACDFGIPQSRERVYCVIIRRDVDNGKFRFPDPVPLTATLQNMLEEDVDEKYYLSDKLVRALLAAGEKTEVK